MSSEEHFRKLKRMYATAPINEFYNPELTISEGRTELVIAVRPEFFHAAGAVHGSVYFKALDDSAFFAVNSLVMDVFVLTASFNIHLLRPIVSGRIHATGGIVHHGKLSFVAESELRDAQDRIVARRIGTFMRSNIRLEPSVGYR